MTKDHRIERLIQGVRLTMLFLDSGTILYRINDRHVERADFDSMCRMLAPAGGTVSRVDGICDGPYGPSAGPYR